MYPAMCVFAVFLVWAAILFCFQGVVRMVVGSVSEDPGMSLQTMAQH